MRTLSDNTVASGTKSLLPDLFLSILNLRLHRRKRSGDTRIAFVMSASFAQVLKKSYGSAQRRLTVTTHRALLRPCAPFHMAVRLCDQLQKLLFSHNIGPAPQSLACWQVKKCHFTLTVWDPCSWGLAFFLFGMAATGIH